MASTRLLAAALWLTATVMSTAVIWTATSVVAADVTDRPPSVVAHQDVLSELRSDAPAVETTTTSTPSTSVPPARSPGRGSVPAIAEAPVAPQPPPPPPAVTVAPLPGPTTTAPAAPNPPPVSPPTVPPPQTATYSTSGGVVRVACNGFFIQLVSAIPTNGYAVEVRAAGPGNVDVLFVGPGPDVPVKVVCFGQPIRYDGPMPMWQPS